MRTRTGLVVFLLLGATTAFGAPRTAAPRTPVSQAKPAAKPVPDPEMVDTQGLQKLIEKYRGKPLLLTFWATWCEPCRDEYPMLNELAKQYAPQGLHVVGVSLDQDGDLILMRRFIARYKPVFPNYRKKEGDEAAFIQSMLPGWNGAIPATFFYAKDGRQIGHVLGEGTRETYEAAISSLLEK